MSDTKHPAGHVLQAHHDGELDPSTTAEVTAHCEHCAACRAELLELERVGRRLAGVPTPELSRTIWPRVRPGTERESRFRPILAFAAGAAGVVLGVLLGPIQLGTRATGTERAWSESVTVWDGGASSSLLAVYQSDPE